MNLITVEFQSNGTSGSILPYSFSDKNKALSRYYTVLSSAVISEVYKCGAIIFDNFGRLYGQEGFLHGEETSRNVWFVVEFQSNGETGSVNAFSYSSNDEAQAKYHQLLSVAAVSSVPYHGAVCFDDDGLSFEIKTYEHI